MMLPIASRLIAICASAAPSQARVPARPAVVDAAVMHDDDGAPEGFADRVGGLDIGGHVLILALGPSQRSV